MFLFWLKPALKSDVSSFSNLIYSANQLDLMQTFWFHAWVERRVLCECKKTRGTKKKIEAQSFEKQIKIWIY